MSINKDFYPLPMNGTNYLVIGDKYNYIYSKSNVVSDWYYVYTKKSEYLGACNLIRTDSIIEKYRLTKKLINGIDNVNDLIDIVVFDQND